MNSTFFSIIIPTYNRAELVAKTIESILNQSYKNFEIIVIDDGSTDNTFDVISSMNNSAIKCYKTENRERGAARNFGISKAAGKYIGFIDSDDFMLSHCLQYAYDFIEENKQPPVFHLAYEMRNTRGQVMDITANLKNINALLIKGNPLGCINIFVRQDVLKEFSFNENRILAGYEDWEMWLRIAVCHTFLLGRTVCGYMLNHEGRHSNRKMHKEQIIQKTDVLMQTVLSNKEITKHYCNKLNLFKCSCYTFASLQLALTKKNRKESLNYLIKGLKENPLFIFEHRFLAILKHLLF